MMQELKKENIWNVPNVLTMVRMLMIPLFLVLFFTSHLMGAMVVYVLAFATDVLDGGIARKYGLITNFGMLMDPLADKLMMVTALISLCVKGWVPLSALIPVVVKEVYMVVGSALLLKRKVVVSARLVGKLATGMFLLAIVTTFFHPVTHPVDQVFLWIAVILSLTAMVWYTWDIWKSLKNRQAA